MSENKPNRFDWGSHFVSSVRKSAEPANSHNPSETFLRSDNLDATLLSSNCGHLVTPHQNNNNTKFKPNKFKAKLY